MTPGQFYDWEVRMLHAALVDALGTDLYARIEQSVREISAAGGAREDTHGLWMYVLFGMTEGQEPDRTGGRVKPYQAWQLGRSLGRTVPQERLDEVGSICTAWPPEPSMFHRGQFNDDVDELSEEWGVIAPLAAKSGIKEPKWLLELFLTKDPSEEIGGIGEH